MPTVCIFQLNKSPAIYSSGETITGAAILQTTSEKNVRDIKLIFLGEAKVEWRTSFPIPNFDANCAVHAIHYNSHEVYINNTTLLLGDGILPAATYTFTFNISLPVECPSSFVGKYGLIQYEIGLKINRYFRPNQTFKQRVDVLRTVNLNLNPNNKNLVAIKACSNLGCWPFSKANIFYRLQIPASAYTPGQCVNYAIYIFNQSMNDTAGYFIEFTKKITFIAKFPKHQKRHTEHVLLAKFFPTKCLRQTNRIINGGFRIPSECAATEITRYISLEYFLKVKIRLNYCSSNPDLVAPLFIGTIPITDNEDLFASSLEGRDTVLTNSLQQQGLPQLSAAADTTENLPPPYDQLIPPTCPELSRNA